MATSKGFLTDTSLCIGCKACEVACKQWNQLPMDGVEWLGTSYDNTHSLGATTWRHVTFAELPGSGGAGAQTNWLMMSDVCKHCTHAGCLEACPTGAIMRTEFDTVVIQQDVCNGCGYCVPSCPFGVVELDVAHGPAPTLAGAGHDGKAHKCTLCYDRLQDGLNRPVPRPARPIPSSSAIRTISGLTPKSEWQSCREKGSTPITTGTSRWVELREWVASAPRSSCWMSRTSTTCRSIPSCRRIILSPGWRRWRRLP